MENTTSVLNVPQDNTSVSTRKNFLYIFIILLVFMLSSLLGYSVQKVVVAKKEQSLNPPTTKPVGTPLEAIVGNSMFSQWSARVKGRLTGVDSASFTISPIIEQYQQDGKRIIIDLPSSNLPTKIYIIKGKTEFYQVTYHDGVPQKTQIAYENIPIGSIIEGSVEFNLKNGSFDLLALTFSLQR